MYFVPSQGNKGNILTTFFVQILQSKG